MSATVSTNDLQAVIAKWRRLIAQLKEENAALDASRAALGEREEELRTLAAEWEETKSETQDAVMKVTAEITASRSEVAALEAQTESLNSRIAQRQEKTAQYKAILATKSAEVEANKERIYAQEEGVRQRLATFRGCRVELKAELEGKVERVAAMLAEEEAASTSRAGELEKRIRQLELSIGAEKKQWEAEKDRRDKEDKVHCLVALRAELAASAKSKAREVSFLKDSSSLKTNIDQSLSEIDGLLAGLTIA